MSIVLGLLDTPSYNSIPIYVDNINQLIGNTHRTLATVAGNAMDAPITMNELRSAVTKGKPNKAREGDGISQDFYKLAWATIKHELLEIVNLMYVGHNITDKQKHNTRSVRKVSDRIFLCEHLMDYNLARLHEPTLNLSAHA